MHVLIIYFMLIQLVLKSHEPALQGEHSTILSTFKKLPYVIKICVLSLFEWQLKAVFTVIIVFLKN